MFRFWQAQTARNWEEQNNKFNDLTVEQSRRKVPIQPKSSQSEEREALKDRTLQIWAPGNP
eukprot:6319135-Amphidinium_carterae.1